jgi:hypothetical protein
MPCTLRTGINVADEPDSLVSVYLRRLDRIGIRLDFVESS